MLNTTICSGKDRGEATKVRLIWRGSRELKELKGKRDQGLLGKEGVKDRLPEILQRGEPGVIQKIRRGRRISHKGLFCNRTNGRKDGKKGRENAT